MGFGVWGLGFRVYRVPGLEGLRFIVSSASRVYRASLWLPANPTLCRA